MLKRKNEETANPTEKVLFKGSQQDNKVILEHPMDGYGTSCSLDCYLGW